MGFRRLLFSAIFLWVVLVVVSSLAYAEVWSAKEKAIDKGWKFRTDPDNKGLDQKWYDPETQVAKEEWKDIEVGKSFQDQGFKGYEGVAWYRVQWDVPEGMKGDGLSFCPLEVNGINDAYQLFINGKKAAEDKKWGMDDPWRKLLLDSSDYLVRGKKNLLVIRVEHQGKGGGILGGVSFTMIDFRNRSDPIVFLVHPDLWPEARPDLEAFAEQVRAYYPFLTFMYREADVRDVQSLRAQLQRLHQDYLITGAIFVGSLPLAKYAFPWGDRCTVPCYYEDLHSTFIDTEGDGYFDQIKGLTLTKEETVTMEGGAAAEEKYRPDIWVSWIFPPKNDIRKLRFFLEKCRKYYDKELKFPRRLFAYVNRDWGGSAPMLADMSDDYYAGKVDYVGGAGKRVNLEGYVMQEAGGAELEMIWAHSAHSGHAFDVGGWLPTQEIYNFYPGSIAVFQFACHAADFTWDTVQNLSQTPFFSNANTLVIEASGRSVCFDRMEWAVPMLLKGLHMGEVHQAMQAKNYANIWHHANTLSGDPFVVFTQDMCAEGQTLNGKVVDADGNPVSGVRVIAMVADSPWGLTYTDREGKFSIGYLPGSAYALGVCSRLDQKPKKVWAVQHDIDANTEVIVKLEKGHRVFGKVTDLDGDPIADCNVVVTKDGRGIWTAATDQEGKFEFFRMADDPLTLTIISKDKVDTKVDVKFEKPGSTEVNIKPDKGVFNVKSDFVRDWLLLGPFEGRDMKVAHIEEAGARPLSGEKVKDLEWQVLELKEDLLDLGSKAECLHYAAAYFRVPQAQDAILWVGSDDEVKVFLNGQMVHYNPAYRGATKDEDMVKVHLRKGVNIVLVKINNGGGPTGGYLRISDLTGRKIEGYRVLNAESLKRLGERVKRIGKEDVEE